MSLNIKYTKQIGLNLHCNFVLNFNKYLSIQQKYLKYL